FVIYTHHNSLIHTSYHGKVIGQVKDSRSGVLKKLFRLTVG
ncbi:uncharacterized protein METZ01_LOCUS243353, partial [marine metagenome]